MLMAALATTSAIAAPARTCRITVKGGTFDIGCLPALSSRGTLVAVPVIDADGDRGLPNLRVVFFPIDGRPPASTVVLTTAEVDELGGGKLGATVLAMIEPRLDLVNAQLSVAGFAPLRAIDLAREGETWSASPAETGALQLALKDGSLEIRGPKIETETVALAHPSMAGCEDASAPFLSGLWSSAADARDLIVRIDYRGGETCSVPRPAWRVVHVRGAASVGQVAPASPASQASQASQASALNTRAMRKFRAKDWAGAAADFRAAIGAFSDHVKAHYNLACLASITRDRATALEQLRWLAASDLAEAEQKIVKARTDPDLEPIRDDPEVQEILARAR